MTFAFGAFVGPSIAGVLVDNFNFGWASLFVVVTELTVVFITLTLVGYRSVTFTLVGQTIRKYGTYSTN